MSLNGQLSGKLEITSPPDRFFTRLAEHVHDPFVPRHGDDSVNPRTRTLTMGMHGHHISESYKKVMVTIKVEKGKNKGSNVKWTVEFEKLRPDIKAPDFIAETLINYLKETDAELHKA